MQILDFKPINKGSLIGTFNLLLPQLGDLIIHEIAFFIKDPKKWISFPSKSYEKDGVKKYFHYLTFKEPQTMWKFQDKVIPLLEEFIKQQQKIEPIQYQEEFLF